MLAASHRYFHRAADVLNLAPKVREILLTPNRVIKVEIVEGRGEAPDFEGVRRKITAFLRKMREAVPFKGQEEARREGNQ